GWLRDANERETERGVNGLGDLSLFGVENQFDIGICSQVRRRLPCCSKRTGERRNRCRRFGHAKRLDSGSYFSVDGLQVAVRAGRRWLGEGPTEGVQR